MNIRRFRAGDGLVLVLPVGLKSAPGNTHMRLDSKTIVDLDFDDPRVQLHQRFLAIEIANGDLVEVPADAPSSPPPEPLPPPPDEPAKLVFNQPPKGK